MYPPDQWCRHTPSRACTRMRAVARCVSTSDATRRVETDPADRRCRECDATSGPADARARLRAQRRPAESRANRRSPE